MITSNINEILTSTQIKNNLDKENKDFFLDSLINRKSIETDENIKKTSDFTFENIKGITLEEIENLFDSDIDKEKAKNLRLTTLFTEDLYLSKALFDTVLGKPFDIGYNYLFDIFEDKSSFFNIKNDSLGDLLHKNILRRYDYEEKKITDKISQTQINEVLAAVNSYSFLETFSSGYKDQYDYYKDDNKYSFLYNDFHLKYQELIYKYDDLKNVNEALINQFK